MSRYNGILGFANEGKDAILGPEVFGTTIDLYLEKFVGGRSYSFFGLGFESGAGTMLDPAIVIFDASDNFLTSDDIVWRWNDTSTATGVRQDAIFSWTPPHAAGEERFYYVGIFNEVGVTGVTYILDIDDPGNSGDAGDAGSGGGDDPETSPPTTAPSNPVPPTSNPVPPISNPVPPASNPVSSGNDLLLEGGAAGDTLVGGSINNRILGYAGNDRLEGGAGDDILFGGSGNNTLIGGTGKDIFVLEKGAGRSIVRDFQRRQDKLGLTAGISFRNLDIEQRGNSTLISLGNDPLMLLTGVRSNQIRRSDFTSL